MFDCKFVSTDIIEGTKKENPGLSEAEIYVLVLEKMKHISIDYDTEDLGELPF